MPVNSAGTILAHYRFGDQELAALHGLREQLLPVLPRLTADFYDFLRTLPETAAFLTDEARLARLRQYHQRWLQDLLSGSYDDAYLIRLQRIGYTHVRIGLPAHFVYVAMNYLRTWLQHFIASEVPQEGQALALKALNKILDLNLDVITRTYHEEELRKVILSIRWDRTIIRFASRFASLLNLVLVVSLLGLACGAIILVIKDTWRVLQGDFASGLIAMLGSLLVLWLVIELLESEINRLKGGAFRLNLFVGVGLVAFIREVLVLSLSPKDIKVEIVYLGGILVMGLVYWLLAKVEGQTPQRLR